MRAVLLTVLSACLVVAAGAARAADVDGDSVADDLEDRTERVLAFRGFPEEAPTTLYARSSAPDGADAFEVDFSRGSLTLAYFPEPTAAEPALSVSLHFQEIVEFVDRDGDSLPGTSERGSAIDLGGVDYRPGTFERATQADGATSTALTVVRQGVSLHVDLASRFRAAEGRPLAPVEVGIGLQVEDFPFRLQESSLALMFSVDGDAAIGAHVPPSSLTLDAAEAARSFTADGSQAYLAWSLQATADLEPVEVGDAAPASGPGPWEFAFTYPAAERVIHAFRLGVLSEAYVEASPAPADPAPVFALSLLAVGGLVAATVWARRR